MSEENSFKHPAILAVWASVVAAGFLLPAFPIIGTGGTFSFANVLNPLSGIFFGPIAGALCSAVGGFIGTLIAPHTAWMGPGTFIIGTTTAFTAGCIAWGKWPPVTINKNGSFIFNGGLIVYFVGTILWFTQEIGRNVILLPVIVYGLGFIAMIAGIVFSQKLFKSKKRILKFPAVWLCSFGGLLGGATIGNFFSLVLYQTPKDVWSVIIVASPIERAIFAFAASLVGVPLITGLNKIGINAGPKEEENEN
ncbi:MAG: ECF transporter S component [Treponema sp.]|nr:ECF transporter S component [Treponema sp.]MCL2237037.1 ECF transporter S component [Treponema sp.]